MARPTGAGPATSVPAGNQTATSQGQTSTYSLWSSHDVRVQELNTSRPTSSNQANGMVYIREYNHQAVIDRHCDPLLWWKAKKDHSILRHFVPLIPKFFCIPATSVPSEQLFSKAGELITKKRNRIKGTMVDQILFLNKNNSV